MALMAMTDRPFLTVRATGKRIYIEDLISGLVNDLRDLRAGKISVRDAQARVELARQILRGVHYVVQAQKFLEGQALPVPKGKTP